MQTNNPLLEQLKDIQLPDPIGWWPLAFSWWILLFSIVAIIAGAIWYYLDLRRRNIYRRSALKQIDAILLKADSGDTHKISEINAILKRVAVTAYGRSSTAALYDQAWLDFLSATASYIPQPENLLEILKLAYQPEHADSTEPNPIQLSSVQAVEIWQDYAKKWIKGHHQ
ncbi:membrane protein [Thiomicrorhabdus immobilis]|uniref:Membrane protein n=1 Tax=Thiomicrorhabdus immobilis TaxID=2791037 RepID=A0ABM7MAC4_9GAMM|nr:DUF4381 domain-containing protein [Thiomicrorhabdus immobilis]BCN92279.1 membrane protein [Thiomicrorhabdus immobilis]